MIQDDAALAAAPPHGDRGGQRHRAGRGQRLPGARLVTIALRRPRRLHPPRRGGAAGGPRAAGSRLADLAHEVAVAARAVHQDHRRRGDVGQLGSGRSADAVMDLVDATEGDDDFPRLRAGVATGMAVSRAGDWFGSPVNLASRVTGAARPGSILVSESTREAIGDDDRFTWSFAGARHLKGHQVGRQAVPRATGHSRKRLISNPSHSQAIAHPGACGKTRVVPQNRRPKPEPAEMGSHEMRVLLSTYGSRGDVEPMVALAVQLRALGAEVRVCAPPDFAELLARVGVPLVPVGPVGARRWCTGCEAVDAGGRAAASRPGWSPRSSTRSPRRPRDVTRWWRPA